MGGLRKCREEDKTSIKEKTEDGKGDIRADVNPTERHNMFPYMQRHIPRYGKSCSSAKMFRKAVLK